MKPASILIALCAILLVFVIYACAVMGTFTSFSEAGIFGDMFGGLNAFFSSIAAIGVVVAILLQQHQIALQKEELKLQRDEIRLQREEMARSRGELARQAQIQEASLAATIVELKLTAIQTANLADQLESERNIPGARKQWIEAIRGRRGQMDKLIAALEQKIEESAGESRGAESS